MDKDEIDPYEQALMEIRKMHPLNLVEFDKPSSLLDGILQCGICGKYFSLANHLGGNYNSETKIYKCKGYQSRKCRNSSINCLYMDNYIVQFIHDFFDKSDDDIKKLIRSEINRRIMECDSQVKMLLGKMDACDAEVNRLIASLDDPNTCKGDVNNSISEQTLYKTYYKEEAISKERYIKILKSIKDFDIKSVRDSYQKSFEQPYELSKIRRFLFEVIPLITLVKDDVTINIDVGTFLLGYNGCRLLMGCTVDRKDILKLQRLKQKLVKIS